MTQDEMLVLAQEAGYSANVPTVRLAFSGFDLYRFAALIEAKLIERLLAGAVEPVAWQATGGSIWGHKSSGDDRALYSKDQLAAAVLREREECAAICDRFQARGMQPAECAGAIQRKRGGNT